MAWYINLDLVMYLDTLMSYFQIKQQEHIIIQNCEVRFLMQKKQLFGDDEEDSLYRYIYYTIICF